MAVPNHNQEEATASRTRLHAYERGSGAAPVPLGRFEPPPGTA